jgi:hypothetical protein
VPLFPEVPPPFVLVEGRTLLDGVEAETGVRVRMAVAISSSRRDMRKPAALSESLALARPAQAAAAFVRLLQGRAVDFARWLPMLDVPMVVAPTGRAPVAAISALSPIIGESAPKVADRAMTVALFASALAGDRGARPLYHAAFAVSVCQPYALSRLRLAAPLGAGGGGAPLAHIPPVPRPGSAPPAQPLPEDRTPEVIVFIRNGNACATAVVACDATVSLWSLRAVRGGSGTSAGKLHFVATCLDAPVSSEGGVPPVAATCQVLGMTWVKSSG